MATTSAVRYFGRYPDPTRPTAIQPPEDLILSAMRSVPYLILKWAPRGNFDGDVAQLEYMLGKGGFSDEDPAHSHTEAASQWAIHRLVEYGMLAVRPAEGRESLPLIEADASLWHWWRNGCGNRHEAKEGDDTSEQADYQSRAIAYFLKEAQKRPPSEITKAEIVGKLNCAESTLSKGRAPMLHAVMDAHKSQSSPVAIRKGSRDAEGNLDAVH